MSFDWTKASEGPDQADRIPAGKNITVTIDRLLFSKKGGAAFKSRQGDPQIMVIFVDNSGREAGQMITLSKKAGWVLARLLSRFGVNTEELDRQGLEPQHFANATIANKYLIGLSGAVNVEWNEGSDGKEYADVEPCENSAGPRKQTAAAAVNPDGYTTIVEDDIPF